MARQVLGKILVNTDTQTDRQVSQLYISKIYEVWTVVLVLEAPYWLSYGQFGSDQNFGGYRQTDRFHNYILVRYMKFGL